MPRLEARGLTKRFGGRTILEGLDLEIHGGEVVGVVGPGGHGKSVLLKHLPALMRPDSGEVRVDGERLGGLGPRGLAAVRNRFGYLFQNYALFDSMSVEDNVGFPLRQLGVAPEEIARRVAARLAEVSLGHAALQLPSELSGGMKKRVGLARATIAEPPLLLYDDPTAGLDPVTSSKIFQLIADLHPEADGGVSVVVGHDLDRMKAICRRWIMVYEGQVIFDGALSDLDRAPDLARRYFEGTA